MPVGVPDTEVFAAADRVLARGERPTVERVRQELGRGSPARVGQLLEIWWDALAKRLAGHTSMPALPEAVASAFAQVWEQAAAAGRGDAQAAVATERAALAEAHRTLREAGVLQAEVLAQARGEAVAARTAAELAEQRIADLQRLLDRQAEELVDLRAQRDAAQIRAAQHEAGLAELRAELAARLTDAQAERAGWGTQIQTLEDRAHREIDRARQDLKALRMQGERTAKEATQRERKLTGALQTAERKIAEQAGRLSALMKKPQVTRRAAKKAVTPRRVGTKAKGD